MRRLGAIVLSGPAVGVVAAAWFGLSAAGVTVDPPPALNLLAGLPLHFEANRGQCAPEVKFLAQGRGFSLFLTDTEAVLELREPAAPSAASQTASASSGARERSRRRGPVNVPRVWRELRLALVGADRPANVEGLEGLPGTVNYFLGNDPARWRTGVPTFARVKFHGVYPGIDLVYYGNQGRLEYDFLVAPGADPRAIHLRLGGADRVEVDAQGRLVAHVGVGRLEWHKPVAYQDGESGRREVPCRYRLQGGTDISFAVGEYDRRRPLVIDPFLIYSTFLGGNDTDSGEAIAVDRSNNVYVAGQTFSTNFPRTRMLGPTNAQGDIFVTKFNSNGTALVYSTHIGGANTDFAHALAVDSAGNAYVAGETDSSNFPVRNEAQTAFAGSVGVPDAFVLKLGAAGTNLVYSTYFGGSDIDAGFGIAVDRTTNNCYVIGDTFSANFPKKNALQNNKGGETDAFIAKFDTSRSGGFSLTWSTYLGGAEDELGRAIAVDGATNVYVTGTVFSTDLINSDFPVVNALQPLFGGGSSDAFIVKINAAGSAKVFATFLGGEFDDAGRAIALDGGTNVYVAGETSSEFFPVTNAAQTAVGSFGPLDAFLVKISPTGTNLLYSTYLGGELDESAAALVVDASGIACLAGYTHSEDFPTTPGALQTTLRGGLSDPSDAFVAVLNPGAVGAASLVFATYLGGTQLDEAFGIAADTNGNCYITGQTTTNDFPTTPGAYQTNYAGGSGDAFVTKLFPTPALTVTRAGANVSLAWPTFPPGFVLQVAQPFPTNWVNATNPVVITNGLNRVTITNAAGARAYRLKKM
jgi:hypothetical protein